MSEKPSATGQKKLIFLELNEINFDVVSKYVATNPKQFPSLQRLMAGAAARTRAEEKYEELEPWIQWVSFYTGLSYADHQVFRLGDSVDSRSEQIFERIEAAGFKVGAISPINADNRLTQPAYFIPDPWTKTRDDGSFWSRKLTQAVAQVVNDNAHSKVSTSSALYLVLGMLRFARPKHWKIYLRLLRHARSGSWRKALLLDLLLADVHHSFFKKSRPDFSALFLNAGAHIQHHYFLNATPLQRETNLRNPEWYVSSTVDPIAEMLLVYDEIIGDLLSSQAYELIVATGLSQKPYDRIKYYYRLKHHAEFLNMVGVDFDSVHPRMTRDFLIEFGTAELAARAQAQLAQLHVSKDKMPLFGEIDNRGTSLFVTLSYPHAIDDSVRVDCGGREIKLEEHVSFVAIKNGMHQSMGYSYFTPGIAALAPADGAHVSSLQSTVTRFFGIKEQPTA